MNQTYLGLIDAEMIYQHRIYHLYITQFCMPWLKTLKPKIDYPAVNAVQCRAALVEAAAMSFAGREERNFDPSST